QLLKLLGDDHYMLVQGGGDNGMAGLRRSLQAMNANDTQAAGMTTAEQAWYAQRAKLELQMQKGQVTGEEYEQQMAALNAGRDQQYQQVLGADGFAAFQKAQDQRYQAIKHLGPTLGFSDNDINGLYATIQNYENDVRDYRDRAQAVEAQGQPVDWPAIEKSL